MREQIEREVRECPICKGVKGFMTEPQLIYSRRWHICRNCDGSGVVPREEKDLSKEEEKNA